MNKIKNKMQKIKNIQKIHVGQDYTKYSFERNGKEEEVEVTGIAQEIINCLGESLLKESFLKNK